MGVVNIDIEEGIHKAIRKEAIDRGIPMKALLKEMIEESAKEKLVLYTRPERTG